MGKSRYLENKVLDHVLKVSAYNPAANLYVALFTVAPTETTPGTEVTGGSYARQLITFAAAVNGQCANNAQITFPQATAGWGTIVAFAVMDLLGGGNVLYFGGFSPTRTILTLDTAIILSGYLTISES